MWARGGEAVGTAFGELGLEDVREGDEGIDEVCDRGEVEGFGDEALGVADGGAAVVCSLADEHGGLG